MPFLADNDVPEEKLATLVRVGLTLAESLDLRAALQVAVESTVDALGFGTGTVYLVEGDEIRLGATTPPFEGEIPEELRRARLDVQPHVREAIETCEPVVIADTAVADLTQEERTAVDFRSLRSVLFVPLVARGRSVGAMVLGVPDELHVFGEADIALCRALSLQIAVAVSNAQLFDAARVASAEFRNAFDTTLGSWSVAMELREDEPRGHSERVAALTIELAAKLGIPESELDDVRRGAMLHDIGKMGVPVEILNKPGPLTEQEWDVMRKHPEFGRDFLSGVEYLRCALDIPYSHHEHWNGTGYPQGLKGEEVPLPARIFAVIDVFDALTSDRPYRKAWTEAEALAHIELQSGIHFDPAVVGVFLERFAPPDA